MSKHQHGLSMLIALLALLLLSLGAAALVRSVDTGAQIVGNFSFKQDATEAASVGAEQAMDWLEAQSDLDHDLPAFGYYASSPAAAAAATAIETQAITVNGNHIQWTITRLCQYPGPSSGNHCLAAASTDTRPSTQTVSERGELSADGRSDSSTSGPYYQIVVRATGPKNTVSRTETMVHF